MSYIITAPTVGSLVVNNSSASPQISYYCNMETITVAGDPFRQAVNLANSIQQTIVAFPLNKITTIAASSPVGGFNLQEAVTEIAKLIIH